MPPSTAKKGTVPQKPVEQQQYIALLMDRYGDYRQFGPGTAEKVMQDSLTYAEENFDDGEVSSCEVEVYPIAGPALRFDIEQAGYKLVPR